MELVTEYTVHERSISVGILPMTSGASPTNAPTASGASPTNAPTAVLPSGAMLRQSPCELVPAKDAETPVVLHELVAACVAEVLEQLFNMSPGEEVTCWEVLEILLSMIRGGTIKTGGDAGVRGLVAENVDGALGTLLGAAVQEKAQREKAQREWWRQREEAQRETNTNYNSRVNTAIRHNLRPNSGREQIMAWWRQRGKVQRVARFSD